HRRHLRRDVVHRVAADGRDRRPHRARRRAAHRHADDRRARGRCGAGRRRRRSGRVARRQPAALDIALRREPARSRRLHRHDARAPRRRACRLLDSRAARGERRSAAGVEGAMTPRDDIDEELHAHLEHAVDDLVRAGVAPDEARRRAVASLGGVTQTAEIWRETRGLPFLEKTMQDLKFAWRLLLKSPGHTFAAILILGLGIGANTAIFSVVNAVVLRPLPFADPSRIMRVWHTPPPTFATAPNGRRIFAVSAANFLDWQAQNHVFDKMALYRGGRFNLTGQGEPDSLRATIVSDDFFAILGVQPLAGRVLGPSDSAPGAPHAVMLSEGVWRRRFGADPTVIGRSISLNNEPYVVTGVVPRRGALPEDFDLWVPLVWTPQERAVRSNHNYVTIARLKPGVDVAAAQAEMSVISQRLERQYPEDDAGWGAVVLPLHDDLVG